MAQLIPASLTLLSTNSPNSTYNSSNATIVNTTSTTILGEPYKCFEMHFIRTDRRANRRDCHRAVGSLPNIHTPGIFHRAQSQMDPFAMPRIKTSGSCRVTIDVQFGRPDESTWQSVGMAIDKVINACAFGYGQGASTGGETTAGSEGRIMITVEKSSGRGVGVGGGENSTGVVATT